MMRRNPLPSDFDGALAFCLDGLAVGRHTLPECLDLYPLLAERLRPLLTAANAFVGVRRLSMPPVQRDALEQRLRSRLAKLPAPRGTVSRGRPMWVRRLSVAAAALVVMVLAGVGSIVAASGSLPGDALYPVKRWSESVSLQFAGTSSKAEFHLQLARRRLEEFEALSTRGVVVVSLLDDFQAEAQAAFAAMGTLPTDRRDEALTRVAALAARSLDVVSDAQAGVELGLDGVLAAISSLREDALRALEALPTPESTETATPTYTPTPTPSFTPSTSPSSTPPGQGTPGGGLTQTPSGEGTPGGGLTATPPSEGTPGGGLTGTPPGQGTPGGGLTPTPPGQGTPGGGQTPKPSKTPKPY